MSEPQEPASPPAVGSWGSMLSVLANARTDAEEAANRPPVAHVCGEPWSTTPDGRLYCRWDGAVYED